MAPGVQHKVGITPGSAEYLLQFARPYKHARHYLGFAEDLERRLAQHRAGRGARLVQVVLGAGIGFEVARTWDGDRRFERQLKNQRNAPTRLCPTRMTPCAPTSRSIRRSGVTCAASTPSLQALSPIPQPRMALGAGVEVVVRREQLTIRGQMPIPAVRRGLRLYPDGDDPYAFRIDLTGLGAGISPVVFSRENGEVTALHLGLTPMSFQKRPGVRNPRLWVNGALAAGATAIAVRRRR